MPQNVIATDAALELIERLKRKHGHQLLFMQSGGCCDNSAPNCYLPHEVTIIPGDVMLGHIGGLPFYITRVQYAYWKHTQLIVDAMDGNPGNFSLEGMEGKTFQARARMFTDEELAQLNLGEGL
ncbi:MAG: DUF779 domain-containing protein [Rhodocyclaceae bacterium]|nr:DUF779 domain-containing protein [Rhodocyclaceae bacterium]